MMNANQGPPLDRPRASRLLLGVRDASRYAFSLLPPGRRMEAAFTLSMDALKLCIAGLRAQGFSESEIHAILNSGRQ